MKSFWPLYVAIILVLALVSLIGFFVGYRYGSPIMEDSFVEESQYKEFDFKVVSTGDTAMLKMSLSKNSPNMAFKIHLKREVMEVTEDGEPVFRFKPGMLYLKLFEEHGILIGSHYLIVNNRVGRMFEVYDGFGEISVELFKNISDFDIVLTPYY